MVKTWRGLKFVILSFKEKSSEILSTQPGNIKPASSVPAPSKLHGIRTLLFTLQISAFLEEENLLGINEMTPKNNFY